MSKSYVQIVCERHECVESDIVETIYTECVFGRQFYLGVRV